MKRLLYRLYFWVFAMPLFCLTTIITALSVIVGCLLGGKRFFSFYPGMLWSRWTLLLTLCRVKVYGREHLKKGESAVFVANHQSAFDIFLIYGYLGVPIKWMMKIELAKLPFVGAACRAAGFIFVDNSSPSAIKRCLLKAEGELKKGGSLVVFPEGARTEDGEMARFRKGAFQVALDLQLPIVPITLNGPYKVLPIGKIEPHPHRMEMVIHPPIYDLVGGTSNRSVLQGLAERCEEIIASALHD